MRNPHVQSAGRGIRVGRVRPHASRMTTPPPCVCRSMSQAIAKRIRRTREPSLERVAAATHRGDALSQGGLAWCDGPACNRRRCARFASSRMFRVGTLRRPCARTRSQRTSGKLRRQDRGAGDRRSARVVRCRPLGSAANSRAGMVELVDTGDLKSPDGNVVRVRIPVPAFLAATVAWSMPAAERDRRTAAASPPAVPARRFPASSERFSREQSACVQLPPAIATRPSPRGRQPQTGRSVWRKALQLRACPEGWPSPAEGTGLENRQGASPRGFESHPLRHSFPTSEHRPSRASRPESRRHPFRWAGARDFHPGRAGCAGCAGGHRLGGRFGVSR